MSTPPPPHPNKKWTFKRIAMVIGIAYVTIATVVVLVIIIRLQHSSPSTVSAPPPQPTTNIYKTISSQQLEAEYRADYNKADSAYTGKVLLIHAVVDDWNGSYLSPALNLNEGYMEADFTTAADEEWIQTLRRGQRVDIICRADGAVSVTFYLRKCKRVVESPEAH
jgi:putative nucleic acid binding protein